MSNPIVITCAMDASFTGLDFCPIFAPSMATMGQKSSLPQPALSVSQVLMPDSPPHHPTSSFVRVIMGVGLGA